ncbi:MAG: sigma-70 family RNA polymerase sigma factor [Bacteroidales bacterium]|nr:sigma-70 family RNA polymerase sigma factor [Bacteroidales bacterium]
MVEQLFEALKSAIDQLPERQNLILVKCKIEGRRQQEVADELGISQKAVEKNLAKAWNHLKQDYDITLYRVLFINKFQEAVFSLVNCFSKQTIFLSSSVRITSLPPYSAYFVDSNLFKSLRIVQFPNEISKFKVSSFLF